MIKLKFNKDKLIPDFKEYFKILISVIILVYVLKTSIIKLFPVIETLSDFWSLMFWVISITYLQNLFDIKLKGRDYF